MRPGRPISRSCTAKDISFDAGKVVARSRAVAKQLSNGVAYLLRKNKVTVFDGHGRLAGKGRLAVAKDGAAVAELQKVRALVQARRQLTDVPSLTP